MEEPKQELSQLEKAEQLVKQLEEQNKTYKELVERQEKAKIESMLGGKSLVNHEQPKPQREMTNKEVADLFGKGINLKDPIPLVNA